MGLNMKKTYETVWEIFNQCSNNQMRDVFIEEVELDEDKLEEYIRLKIKDRTMTYERFALADGTIVFNIIASGMKQRYSFTQI